MVDRDKAELGTVAFGPFEIVEGGPMQVATDVDAFADCLGERGQMGVQVRNAFVVVVGGDAVLGDVDGKPDLGRAVKHLA
jgi:hypothetical protein